MADRQVLDQLKKAYTRWHDTRGGSVDDWMDLLDDDIQFGSLAQRAPQMRFAAEYDNRTGIRRYFDGLLAEWDMIHHSMNEFIVDGDVVVVRGSVAWRHKRTGKEVESPKIDFRRFRNGKAIEFYEYFDTARAFAAASDDPRPFGTAY